MLPENQFHAAPVESPKKNRSNFYSTQQVLEKTLMSRSTLFHKVEDNTFPSPVNPGANGQNYYVKTEVDEWIEKNIAWISKRKQVKTITHSVTFEKHEAMKIKVAAAALGCNYQKFINDAATWKAHLILKQLEREGTTEYYD